jgi:hypothetical protein
MFLRRLDWGLGLFSHPLSLHSFEQFPPRNTTKNPPTIHTPTPHFRMAPLHCTTNHLVSDEIYMSQKKKKKKKREADTPHFCILDLGEERK